MQRSYKSRKVSSASRSVHRPPQRRRRKSGAGALVVVLVLLVAVSAAVLLLTNDDGKPAVNPGVSVSPSAQAGHSSDKIYDGVSVDGISLGGLTRAEAKQKIEQGQQTLEKTAAVTVQNGSQSTKLMLKDISHTFDTDDVVEQAWQVGRHGTNAEKAAAVDQLKQTPVKLKTAPVIDAAALEQHVSELAAPYAVAAVNATLAGYDEKKPEGQRLTFTPDVPGKEVDVAVLTTAIKKEFETGAYGTVQMQVAEVPAAVTKADLQAGLQLVGKYETEIRNSKKPRLKNIELAGKTFSGKLLMPDEIFSLNDSTGERTEAKGYEKAPVDSNGIEDVGLAGGVCQVSGTLYNAAIAAGPKLIEIVERHYHSLPSAYMGLGYDATVDYDSKDLRFKNISGKPLLLVVYYDYDKSRKYDYHEHAEIYGVPDTEGATYRLVCKKVKTIPAKPGYRTTVSNALQPGETKHFDAHPGYVVDRFLEKTAKDGTVTSTKIGTDTYPADCEVYAHYKNDDPWTPTPSPSATPESTQPPPTNPPTDQPTEPAPPPPTEPTTTVEGPVG